jgi:hypothetical protein
MDYLSRKISGFLPSSSPPAASTRKRKASTLSDTEDLPPTNNDNALNSSASVSSHYGYLSPVSPQRKRRRVTAMIEAREARQTSIYARSANKATYKSRVATPRIDRVLAVTEQDIQEQLLLEYGEEGLQEQREVEQLLREWREAEQLLQEQPEEEQLLQEQRERATTLGEDVFGGSDTKNSEDLGDCESTEHALSGSETKGSTAFRDYEGTEDVSSGRTLCLTRPSPIPFHLQTED